MAASASETETRVPPAPSVSTSTPTPTPNGAPYARPPDSPVTSASDVEQSACASQSAARAAAATCADTFLEHKFAEVARAPSLAVILEELEAHKFRVRPLRLGELRATERSATGTAIRIPIPRHLLVP